MKRISVLFAVLVLVVCFAACKSDKDKGTTSTDETSSLTSSGFEIIITDDSSEIDSESDAATKAELDEIASAWENASVTVTVSSSSAGSSSTQTSSVKDNSASSEKTSSVAQSSSVSSGLSEVTTSSKPQTTSVPEYFEGAY